MLSIVLVCAHERTRLARYPRNIIQQTMLSIVLESARIIRTPAITGPAGARRHLD